MMLFITVLTLWIIAMCLVTYLFCGAAREFVSSASGLSESEMVPVKRSRPTRE